MKIRTRIYIALFCSVFIGVFLLWQWSVADLEPQYRRTTEEPLVDAARLLASIASASIKDGAIDIDLFRRAIKDAHGRKFTAKIYDYVKEHVDFRVYITDSKGIVVFHSYDQKFVGADFSEWRDVRLSLIGEYGARTSRDVEVDPQTSVMYVSSPIYYQDKIFGVLSVGNPTNTANKFVKKAEKNLLLGVIVICLIVLVLSMWVSRKITKPIEELTTYARDLKEGKRVLLPNLGESELGKLGKAFDDMKQTLDGKLYVEEYVQTFSHEIKSPLAAIQGAAELLEEDMAVEQRSRFIHNIHAEAKRIEGVVERLLLLSSVEKYSSRDGWETVDFSKLVSSRIESARLQLERKSIVLKASIEDEIEVSGDKFLLEHAVMNILQNAIDFSSENEEIEVTLVSAPRVQLTVKDFGPGIPGFALENIFQRFFSLQRPDSGRKSSGLGLSLVKEVVSIHNGDVSISNHETGGVRAVLEFPLSVRDS